MVNEKFQMNLVEIFDQYQSYKNRKEHLKLY